MAKNTAKNDDRLDLVLTRVVDLPRTLIWKAWTTPEYLMQWFTPAPWKTVDCEIDLRPGGICRTVMRSPEGKDHENIFCYLEIVENEKLVWTDALGPGYRPSLDSFMTAIVTFEDLGGKTRYSARALHKNDADRQKHIDMGFDQGWNKALDQLIEVARRFK